MKRSTIYDVAAAAKVSPMTVSLALRPSHGRIRMTPLTRDRILDAARRMNFRPHPAAKGLRVGRTHNVGFYINRPEYLNLSVPNWHRVISAMLDRLWKHGYQLGFYFFEPDNREGFDEFLTPHRFVDGIVVQGRNLAPKEIAQIRRSKLRTVSLYEKIEGFHSLEVDEFAAGQMAAEYLYECGHRQVGLIASRMPQERWAGRARGFLARAAELGIDVPDSAQVYWDDVSQSTAGRHVGRELFQQYARKSESIRCLYVPSDYLSFGVVDAIDERGWKLGRDFSLLSYDNLEGAGQTPWGRPRLTSFDPPYGEIGTCAADILADSSFSEQDGAAVSRPKLIERDSVAKVLRRYKGSRAA